MISLQRKALSYWRDPAVQKSYIEWLKGRLKVNAHEDWYRVSVFTFTKNNGKTLLALYNNSPAKLITSMYPQHPWLVWRFRDSDKFSDIKDQRLYMEWLGHKLGYNKLSDWYNVKLYDFMNNHGEALVVRYRHSPSSVVSHIYPEYDWKGWLFSETSNMFWNDNNNIRDYMSWLGLQLGFTTMSDWYQIRCDHFFQNKGRSLLMKFGSSPSKVVTNVFNTHPWLDHLFHRLPKNSSKIKLEAVAIMSQAEILLQIKEPDDWYRISKLQLRTTLGDTLCKILLDEHTDNLLSHLQSCYPLHKWEKDFFVYFGTRRSAQRLLRLIVAEILCDGGNNSILIVEDYVHPTIRFRDTQCVTFDLFVPSLNMAFEYLIYVQLGIASHLHHSQSVVKKHNKSLWQNFNNPLKGHVFTNERTLQVFGFPKACHDICFFLWVKKYGGQQHYDPHVFGKQNKHANDVEKQNLALAHGITLIDIPYWWDKKKDSVILRINEATNWQTSSQQVDQQCPV
eukprot:Phypoly_transcript_05422.p1 GENE.Phypoly_transcript_05422~~Phypoly_transcript_05422.p1  ORF type:complete len:507 (+),score=23.77 Phypoly_transcript_05422:84-1604(+)